MDVRRLELLRELADRGSIAAVAAATHRTPSAVSQQLKVLEREAGVPLTERVGRGIQLTGAGAALAATARQIATAIESAEALWSEFTRAPQGTVTLSTFPTAGQMLLPGLLTMLTDEPGLEVAVTDHDLDRPDWATLTPDFDIVLADSQGVPAHWSQGGLRVITLMTEPFDVAMPLGHRLADKAVLKPADLVDEPWVGAPVGYPYDRVLDGLAAYTGRAPRIVQRIMDNLIVERLVAAGIGLAILPRFTTRIHDTGIVTRPIAGIPAERQINALLRADRAERPSVRRILELLELEGRRVQSRYQHPAHRR
ncbi:DNA-binding transcriptional LysR family regulator [Microcella putealis]|uniref:DNA-binding transcriptional LysR family regulator n=1 Tax=Microcella putealis TaxID=337005 RepID=A0A4Q7LSW1_9MICO|nr:LysR family transcriptional regulator [Microcella putealis]RZS57493.1 DNA-binding transcriptional LysR family regulator [Microcella putealis]TQM24560.1 DNA-binding transcriptional LysR family regulator [Microcella putealis]